MATPRRRLPVGVAALLLAGALVVPAAASATETICDPENPACSNAPAPEEAAGEEADDEADDEAEAPSDTDGSAETICDPENPACALSDDEGEGDEGEGASEEEASAPTLEPVLPGDADEEGTGATESSPGGFERAQFSGSWGSSVAVDTSFDGPTEDIVEMTNRFALELDYEVSRTFGVVVGGEFVHWMAGRENPDAPDLLVNSTEGRALYEARLESSYVAWRPGRVSLRVGNLRSPWGSTDLVRPGDVVNPRDLRFGGFGAAGASTLRPQLTGELSYRGSWWSATALVIPFFVPDRVALFGRDTAFANNPNSRIARQNGALGLVERFVSRAAYEEVQPLLFGGTNPPDETPENISLAGRLSATLAGTDLGLGYYFGWDRTPWLTLDESARELLGIVAEDDQIFEDFSFLRFINRNPEVNGLINDLSRKRQQGEEIASTEFLRRHSLVVDAARYFGPIGVRADANLTFGQNLYTEDFTPARRPTFFGALGVSWERLSEDAPIAITVEGFWLHPFARDSGLTETFVDPERRGPPDARLAFVGDNLAGVAAAVSGSPPGLDADLQLGGVWTATNGDLVASASFSYRWTESLTTAIGGVLYEGPDPADAFSIGGLYDRNDQIFITVSGRL
jgi:hypothetical protein